jgi:hypothetical protein
LRRLLNTLLAEEYDSELLESVKKRQTEKFPVDSLSDEQNCVHEILNEKITATIKNMSNEQLI